MKRLLALIPSILIVIVGIVLLIAGVHNPAVRFTGIAFILVSAYLVRRAQLSSRSTAALTSDEEPSGRNRTALVAGSIAGAVAVGAVALTIFGGLEASVITRIDLLASGLVIALIVGIISGLSSRPRS